MPKASISCPWSFSDTSTASLMSLDACTPRPNQSVITHMIKPSSVHCIVMSIRVWLDSYHNGACTQVGSIQLIGALEHAACLLGQVS